jgi:signal transduction histidine kinase
VPVLRGGVLRYILSLAVVPDAIGAILDTAGAPPGWLGVVVDANGHILARTGDPHEMPGELASLGLLDAIAPGRSGFHEGVTRGGLRIETVTRSLPRTGGWMVAFGIPVSVLQHPVRHALLVLAAIGCGSLALAAGLSSLVARDLHRRRVAERDQATKQAVADRQALLRRLSLAQEEERRRLSRELHDQVGQSVTGLSLGLKALERHGQVPVAALQALQAMANDIGRDIHRAAADLRPAALDDLGLKEALAALAAGCAQPTGVRIEIQEVGDMAGLPAEIDILVYRVVQEALNNVLKHAQANSVSVVLERSRAKLRVIIEDDGIGFDPARLPDPAAPPALGLLGMRERLDLVGGGMTIESAPGAGATLFIDIPLAPAEPEVQP